ncbi:dolichol-phosphate mannosyltransferase subunit 3 [Flagelloscypha sp. PMI_526]|nr:dolichol-phosphate mannosyltransferase subunit 3 [Flagelloscypha sp. PMI_526]
MARAHRVAILFFLTTILYISAFLELFSLPFIEKDVADQLVPVLPWWLLVSFGSFSLWSLGWGLWTFRDCPEAYKELMSEISEAKNSLRSRGVTVD